MAHSGHLLPPVYTGRKFAMMPESRSDPMVFAVVFEFRSETTSEALIGLGGLHVSKSIYLIDVADTAARSVYTRILQHLRERTGLPGDDLFTDGDVLYVVPVTDGVMGRGPAPVAEWLDRRGLHEN
jgi:hypothetical protein